jgi:hypothetical protein
VHAVGNGVHVIESPPNRSLRNRVPKTIFVALIGAAAVGIINIAGSDPARALPSFARQTGQPCGTCHTDFPGLTPFGRQFKLGGYTAGGGKFRTTLFPAQDDATNALAAYAKKTDPGKSPDPATNGQPDTSNIWVPPISMMTIVGMTNTQKSQDPTGSPYNSNNNVVVAPLSFFYGGAITEHIGAFVQATYVGSPFGAQDLSDKYAEMKWTWDNTDIRYANTARLACLDVIYGVTANNNPSVQDPWNTTPAWGFPYAASTIAPTPGAGTFIDGTFAAHVGGVGGYAWINNLLYLELAGYRTVAANSQAKLGTDPFGAPGTFGSVSPYWRAAVEPHWGNHWLEFGAFGMSAKVHPWTFIPDPATAAVSNNFVGLYTFQTFSQTDQYKDTAFDTQYQYQGDNYWITLRGTYIRETQHLDATFISGGSSNLTNKLNTTKLMASLAFGNDNRIVLTGQHFETWGSSDPILYGSNASGVSPDSKGYIAEIAYIPFGMSNAPLWPWANARIGLQYTYYNKFDGDTVHAHDNNTLFLYAWFAM